MHRISALSAILLLSACRTDSSAPTVTISPLSPTTVDDLVAGVDNCDDCQYRWFEGGTRAEGIDGNTVSAELTTKGETWSVLVTEVAGDGSEGLPGEAEVLIENSLPELSGLALSATEVYTEDVLAVSLEATDADGDELTFTYNWLVDGVDVGENTDSLSGLDFFDKGQTVAVSVTATDGEGESQVSSEVLTVLNTPPSAPGVSIQHGGDLLCEISARSEDLDGDEITYTFAWDVDGTLFEDTETTEYEGDTVTLEELESDGLWSCTVTPEDEDGPGPSTTAEYEYVVPAYTKLGGGGYFGCLLNESEMELFCWGDDTNGTVSAAPVSGVKDISGDMGWHGCIINLNDELECWGDNTYSQLDGVPGGTYQSVVSGDAFGCALTLGGDIDCWGRNHVGQASPPSGSFTKIAAGYLSGCGIETDGDLSCWGMTASPTVPSSLTTIDVSIGALHSCALDSGGSVHCWQSGTQGNSIPGSEPSGVFAQVLSGANHVCMLDRSGSVECWGDDQFNQVTDAPSGSGYIDISGGWNHTCVLHPTDGVVCWGDGSDPVVTDFPK
jgi:hypothetical protein